MSCIMVFMGPDDCGACCISRGEAGVTPYRTGVEKCDDYEGNVVLPRTGSDEPADSVVRTTGFGEPVDSVVRTSGPDEPVMSSVSCPAGPVMRNMTIMRGMLSYPGSGPMSRSPVVFILPGPMSWSTVLL